MPQSHSILDLYGEGMMSRMRFKLKPHNLVVGGVKRADG